MLCSEPLACRRRCSFQCCASHLALLLQARGHPAPHPRPSQANNRAACIPSLQPQYLVCDVPCRSCRAAEGSCGGPGGEAEAAAARARGPAVLCGSPEYIGSCSAPVRHPPAAAPASGQQGTAPLPGGVPAPLVRLPAVAPQSLFVPPCRSPCSPACSVAAMSCVDSPSVAAPDSPPPSCTPHGENCGERTCRTHSCYCAQCITAGRLDFPVALAVS
jgi:hypothetical protein